jgi:hypothetical protein
VFTHTYMSSTEKKQFPSSRSFTAASMSSAGPSRYGRESHFIHELRSVHLPKVSPLSWRTASGPRGGSHKLDAFLCDQEKTTRHIQRDLSKFRSSILAGTSTDPTHILTPTAQSVSTSRTPIHVILTHAAKMARPVKLE